MASYRDLAGALEALCRAVEVENVGPTSALLLQAKVMVAEARRGDVKETRWTRFVSMDGEISDAMIKLAAAAFKVSEAVARATVEAEIRETTIWTNSRYQVLRREIDGGAMIYLSIKRLDQKPIRSWRDLQRIKTELVGAECEGVELFPAESRVTDTANQYHLWVLTDPDARIPLGFATRRNVRDDIDGGEGQAPVDD